MISRYPYYDTDKGYASQGSQCSEYSEGYNQDADVRQHNRDIEEQIRQHASCRDALVVSHLTFALTLGSIMREHSPPSVSNADKTAVCWG
jgi:hypothetical protein